MFLIILILMHYNFYQIISYLIQIILFLLLDKYLKDTKKLNKNTLISNENEFSFNLPNDNIISSGLSVLYI